jgi:neurofibromin 1
MTSQKVIWIEISKLDSTIVNIALDELMRAAIDGGASSDACEVIASIMTPLSSINVRGQILSKMRKVSRSILNLEHYWTGMYRHSAKLL